jgi:nucleotide-binding universal stress UspA family protein
MKDKIITIASYPYSRAQLLKGRLESEGIECFLSNINLVQGDISSGVKIRINEEDLENALRIIEQIKDEYGAAKQKTIDKLKNVRRILVPVDFSEKSENACIFALGLANILKAELKLIYSYFNPLLSTEPYFEGFEYYQLDGVVGNLHEEAKLMIQKLVGRINQFAKQKYTGKIKISYFLDRGIPGDIILQFCEVYQPGVIVIGTQSKQENKTDLIGNVLKKLIGNINIPVLAVPHKPASLGVEYIHKVLYATDFNDSDFKALRKLMTFLRPFNIKIYCVHIAYDATNFFDSVKMELLRKHFSEEYGEFNLVCDMIQHSDVVEGLDEFIDEKDIDLIALTTHKRTLFERIFNPSLARKMLFHTNIPVFIFQS